MVCISYLAWEARAGPLSCDTWPPLPGAMEHQKMTLQNNLYCVRVFVHLFVNITSITNI